MALTPGKKMAVYLLLSHPLSYLRRQLDFLTPQATQSAAIQDVVNLLVGTLNANADAADLTTLIRGSGIIVLNTATNTYRITTDQNTLGAMDGGYSSDTGCPDSGQSIDIYANLGNVRPHAFQIKKKNNTNKPATKNK